METNPFSDLRRDDYAFKIVQSTSVANGVPINVTLNETGWQWAVVEFGQPSAVCQMVVRSNGNSYDMFATTALQFRALSLRIDPLSTVDVRIEQYGATTTGVIVMVARGWPVIPVHSH